MPCVGNQKMKLLYIYGILKDYTDEDKGLSLKEITDILENKYGITAERKSIYADIAALKEFGIDVCMIKSRDTRYYLGSREFEFAELKILVDLVQNSKFITKKKSAELISKIEKLTSIEKGELLQRQVCLSPGLKTGNEQIYYNVDKLHRAIISAKQIEFLYCQWCLNYGHYERVIKGYKRDGEKYTVSPYGLVFNDDNYYLVAYDEKSKSMKHYRVDKMERIEITDKNRNGLIEFLNLDFPSYKKQVFGMFGGKPEKVKIWFNNSLVGAVADRFGKEVEISQYDEDRFIAQVNVVASSQFFGWVFAFGDGARIIEPKSTVKEFKKFAKSVIKLYNKN